MTNLKCSVENCTHNCDHLCGLDEIQVDGEKAQTSTNTCCSSFREQSEYATNSSAARNARPETFINCTAKECAYNGDCKCHAETIDMSGLGASTSEHTECSTFIKDED